MLFYRIGKRFSSRLLCIWRSSYTVSANVPTEKLRNIGIMAHIDAGKTTTTERMLYISGSITNMGNVDEGNTVTDFMEEERERGITINSAAVSFYWKDFCINLIDTPGHVDFTIEVERSLRVLDGAIALLDASAGVEAQTVTVWQQANKNRVPRILYLNKMDKPGANFMRCLESVKEKLRAHPLPVHLPVVDDTNTFCGVIDVIALKKIVWQKNGDKDGKLVVTPIEKQQLLNEALQARRKLVEYLADIDERVADYVLQDMPIDDIPSDLINASLRRATLLHNAVPVLCGSSFRKIGVELLMDAVVRYLPSPLDIKHDFLQYYERDELCALAFKAAYDKYKGLLTFVRIYSGSLKPLTSVFNVNKGCVEKVTQVFHINADDFVPIAEGTAGSLVAVSGLSQTITGDTLSVSQRSNSKGAVDRNKCLASIPVPDPVYFCSVEPPSPGQFKALEQALQRLSREDPSLRVKFDEEAGQLILSGMGELHLEVIKHRLQRDFGIDVFTGPLLIAYRETILSPTECSHSVEMTVGSQKHVATMTLSVDAIADLDVSDSHENNISFTSDKSSDFDWKYFSKDQLHAIENGIHSALNRGPTLGFPLVRTSVTARNALLSSKNVPLSVLAFCASQTASKALANVGTVLLQPIMKTQIVTNETHLSDILGELSRRFGQILDVSAWDDQRTVEAHVPLAHLEGFAKQLRSVTSGTANFSLHFYCYEKLSGAEQTKVVQHLRNLGM